MISAKEIALKYNGKIIGDENAVAYSFCSIKDKKQNSLTYVLDSRYYSYIENSLSSVIIAPFDESFPKTNISIVMVKSPNYVFNMILRDFYDKKNIEAFIDPTSYISDSAKIADNCYIGRNVYIDDNVSIGPNSAILANTYIGKNTIIKNNAYIYPNVSIMNDVFIDENVIIHSGVVIGSDGFGFLFDSGEHIKIPQIGTVLIGKNVEIGANTTIDRGAIGDTIVGDGTKIDNLVQIAHNVEIGKHCIICAQVGIAGSTVVGDYVTFAGQAGISGHIKIGRESTIAAQAGVTKNVKQKEIVSGYPAMNHREASHLEVLKRKLPEIYETIKYLQKELKEIKNK